MLPETNSPSRAKVKWPVTMDTDEGSTDGVVLNINKNGAFIRCHKPLRLTATCKLSIESPDHPIENVIAEVVWTNMYGPDDDYSPRGMGVRFTEMAEQAERFLRKLVNGERKSEDVREVNLDEVPDVLH